MITICFTYFKSLSLANFQAALYSVWQQDLSYVNEIIIVDNDTADSVQDMQKVLDALPFSTPARLFSFKHGDPLKTHSWSTNVAVRKASTEWVFFCRADYVLDFDLVERFVDIIEEKPAGWNGFLTGNVYHLGADIAQCEQVRWRELGPETLRRLPGTVAEYTCIDAGVWMARRETFEQVGGLDEGLTAWGHAQTYFQYKLHRAGVECVRVPEVLFYHPQHAAPRDLDLAHQQLHDHGVDLRELWARHDGARVY